MNVPPGLIAAVDQGLAATNEDVDHLLEALRKVREEGTEPATATAFMGMAIFQSTTTTEEIASTARMLAVTLSRLLDQEEK